MKRAPKAALFSLVGLLAVLALAACSEATPTAMPSSILDHFKRGNELSQNGQFEEAAAEYRLALDADPENVDVLANLGVALYNLGQLDEAIELYQKATELAPEDADLRSNLAAAYVQKHQLDGEQDWLDQALEEYQQAIELNAELAEAHFGLGVVYTLLGRDQNAIQAFEEFQDLDTGKDAMATQMAEEYLKQLRGQ